MELVPCIYVGLVVSSLLTLLIVAFALPASDICLEVSCVKLVRLLQRPCWACCKMTDDPPPLVHLLDAGLENKTIDEE